MLSIINLIPVIAIPAAQNRAQNAIPQQFRPQNVPEMNFKTFMLGIHSMINPFVRVASYQVKLSSNASFSLKIKCLIFRIWNAVKAIFYKSEWQCANKRGFEIRPERTAC